MWTHPPGWGLQPPASFFQPRTSLFPLTVTIFFVFGGQEWARANFGSEFDQSNDTSAHTMSWFFGTLREYFATFYRGCASFSPRRSYLWLRVHTGRGRWERPGAPRGCRHRPLGRHISSRATSAQLCLVRRSGTDLLYDGHVAGYQCDPYRPGPPFFYSKALAAQIQQ